MDVEGHDVAVSSVAAAIGEPARARMLFSLMDGHARTSTELAAVAGVSPSTASVHLSRLKANGLIDLVAQGKHRYYSLAHGHVAPALEALSVLAGGAPDTFVPKTPGRLRAARTCYDHMAGSLAVSLHDRFTALRWLVKDVSSHTSYEMTSAGARVFEASGLDLEKTRALRRRFAYACLDWSERRPHLGGALGAALSSVALERKWVTRDLDSRALSITKAGRRDLHRLFGVSDL